MSKTEGEVAEEEMDTGAAVLQASNSDAPVTDAGAASAGTAAVAGEGDDDDDRADEEVDAAGLRGLFPEIVESDKVIERAIDHVKELKQTVTEQEGKLAEMRARNKLLRHRAEQALAKTDKGKEGSADDADADTDAAAADDDADTAPSADADAAAEGSVSDPKESLRQLLNRKAPADQDGGAQDDGGSTGEPPAPEGRQAKSLDHLVPSTAVE
jgi:hypothetical protein